MNSFFTWIVIGLVIAVVGILVLSRSKSRGADDSAESILGEVDIYISYGRTSEAVSALQTGLKKFPENPALQRRLDELLTDLT